MFRATSMIHNVISTDSNIKNGMEKKNIFVGISDVLMSHFKTDLDRDHIHKEVSQTLSGAPFTNMVQIKSQHDWIITNAVKCGMDVWEWMSHFIPYYIMISYACLEYSQLSILLKGTTCA